MTTIPDFATVPFAEAAAAGVEPAPAERLAHP